MMEKSNASHDLSKINNLPTSTKLNDNTYCVRSEENIANCISYTQHKKGCKILGHFTKQLQIPQCLQIICINFSSTVQTFFFVIYIKLQLKRNSRIKLESCEHKLFLRILFILNKKEATTTLQYHASRP